MKTKSRIKVFVCGAVLIIALSQLVFIAEGKGGSGGGGRGGYSGGRGGRSSGSGKKIALGAAAAGVVGYAAYKQHKSPHRFHSNPNDNPAFVNGGGGLIDEDYSVQESTYYNRGEGFGMSAFGLICLILGIIGGCTLCWYCFEVCIPIWREKNAERNRSSLYEKEGHPLQETPSTATPSP